MWFEGENLSRRVDGSQAFEGRKSYGVKGGEEIFATSALKSLKGSRFESTPHARGCRHEPSLEKMGSGRLPPLRM